MCPINNIRWIFGFELQQPIKRRKMLVTNRRSTSQNAWLSLQVANFPGPRVGTNGIDNGLTAFSQDADSSKPLRFKTLWIICMPHQKCGRLVIIAPDVTVLLAGPKDVSAISRVKYGQAHPFQEAPSVKPSKPIFPGISFENRALLNSRINLTLSSDSMGSNNFHLYSTVFLDYLNPGGLLRRHLTNIHDQTACCHRAARLPGSPTHVQHRGETSACQVWSGAR
jgi:hypothetical protein